MGSGKVRAVFAAGFKRDRSTRLLLVLAAVCALHAVDLALTQDQVRQGFLIEANGLAATVADSPSGLAAYKVTLLGTGVLVLFTLRHHQAAEVGGWVLLASSVGLMVWWAYYLHFLDQCLRYPATLAF